MALSAVQARAWELHHRNGHPTGYDGPCWGPTLAELEQAAAAPHVRERRADGWPLCPQCGEDELWSPLLWDGTAPPIAAFEAAGLRCYLCGWAKPPGPAPMAP